jgi:hypothetical protein
VEVAEITPAAVTEDATSDPVAEVEVPQIVAEEAAPAPVEQEVKDVQVEEGIVEATVTAVEPTEPAASTNLEVK